jgi:hypothetical protein
MPQTLEEIKSQRGYTSEQLEAAKLIDAEVRHAKKFAPESELGKVGTMGYKAGVGNPDDWWSNHCVAYREASTQFPKARDLNTVCLLADSLLNS